MNAFPISCILTLITMLLRPLKTKTPISSMKRTQVTTLPPSKLSQAQEIIQRTTGIQVEQSQLWFIICWYIGHHLSFFIIERSINSPLNCLPFFPFVDPDAHKLADPDALSVSPPKSSTKGWPFFLSFLFSPSLLLLFISFFLSISNCLTYHCSFALRGKSTNYWKQETQICSYKKERRGMYIVIEDNFIRNAVDPQT